MRSVAVVIPAAEAVPTNQVQVEEREVEAEQFRVCMVDARNRGIRESAQHVHPLTCDLVGMSSSRWDDAMVDANI